MTNIIRIILIVAAMAFAVASSIHGGVLLGGWEHREATIAEGVIAAVLALGLLATWIWPTATGGIALGVQGFALLGTLVGALTIAVGVGPQTTSDIIYHALLIIGLVCRH